MTARIRHLAEKSLGTSPCEITLAKLLNENPECMRKVTHFLHEFRTNLRRFTKIEESQPKESKRFIWGLVLMWFDNCQKRVDQFDAPEIVRTHLHTCLKASWRNWLREREERKRDVVREM
jgi:hypothetical protein